MTAAKAAAVLFLCCTLTACRSSNTREFDRSSLPPPPAKVEAARSSLSSPPAPGEAPARPLPKGPVARVEPYPVGSTDTVLRGPDAMPEIQKRATSGGKANSLVWKDGKMTVTTDYPDGSSMSIVSDSNGSELEFRPAK